MVLDSKERLSKVESQLAQLEFLIHHSADMAANRALMRPGEAAEDTEPHHVLEGGSQDVDDEVGGIEHDRTPPGETEGGSQDVDDEIGGIENDRTPTGETEEELREDSLLSDIQSHESEPPQQRHEDDIPPHEGQLVAGHEEYQDLPNVTEQVEPPQSERESALQRQHSENSEQTEADQM